MVCLLQLINLQWHPTYSNSVVHFRVNSWFCIFYQIRSVVQSCPTLHDPMNRSTPGFPVHHQLPEFTQTHVQRVSDAIQPSHPLSSPSPPAPNPSLGKLAIHFTDLGPGCWSLNVTHFVFPLSQEGWEFWLLAFMPLGLCTYMPVSLALRKQKTNKQHWNILNSLSQMRLVM